MTDTATNAVTARYAGQRVPRVEDSRLLTGHGRFVDDISRPGMLHACFVRSPFAHATINGVDASAALALPGVHAVFTAADLNPDVKEAWHAVAGKDVPDTPRPPLAEGEVKFVGDPVALVVADSRYLAEDAVDLVEVDYDPLPAVADFRKAVGGAEAGVPVVHAAYPDNVAGGMGGMPPDEEIFATAAHVVEEHIYQQMYVPVPMETRGMVVEWTSTTNELTVWASTQTPHELRAFAARLLGIPAQGVRVIMRDTGGAFGQKVVPMREDMCILLAARKMPTATSNAQSGVAVKWIEDRRENLMSAGQSRHVDGKVRMAFDSDGKILAADIDFVQDVGSYPTPYPVLTTAAIGMFFPGPYRVPKASFNYKTVFSNTPGLHAYRGPWQYETLTREMLLDSAARKIGMDPVELRRINILRGDEMPFFNPNGMPYDNCAPADTFEQAVKILDHEGFRKEQADALAEGRYIGLGFSAYIEPTGAATGNLATEGATIRMESTGKINVYVNGGSAGNSIETTVVQLTADALGANIEDVATIQGDTAVTPYGAGTQGSRSAPMTAGAVNEAGAILRRQIIAIGAQILGVEESEIELANSRAGVRNDPERSVSFADIAYRSYYDPAQLGGVSPTLEATARFNSQAMIHWANATHVCTCEVDVETGQVTLTRYIVSEDVGPMINPNIVEGQVAGGTVQGIGGALLEKLAYDDAGNPVASTFVDYLLPTATEVPPIEFGHVEIPGPGVGGYKGAGEGGAIGSPPAVINAINDALAPLGVTLTQLPATPATIVELIERAGKDH
ncbi:MULTISPECIES: xanthine dehydrogenase family protein molybdopterin-binding subunit [Mycolicibacterium]|uniref:Xanthine dehydrogenase, molybdenum binding subunit apoprotein n=1 Tax=Mycolicibacterium vanbaalenii (strain DSM 7251 / JCM 13017 / BCRC 16820 / KCTC 9966 / NRRL B-24157 / PYR-1) TaxID=350058 RepID=A1TFK4_MYCVP|nr:MULTISPECIES: xanthine dehydrogenase family protein molybdopterin-binding subunit [Mycolicibacterium]ABM15954.1 xanthine dehydrogenase, molybdenum binding subunit apoprotein [Mycolicibacterium vanbaalenii PYR-1]MCV7128916.1 xanthine dehydrogenase family protein molybdopterin-binding subunit [Mycolicibacterium vanbaalenii PYR-1]QZT56356.1 xanthine dehydrogenase family protein molybdopterin-binding subunit [Mycolicibacterium austroafricanum]QZY45506.1 xanthine dehydrogenase family protein moly